MSGGMCEIDKKKKGKQIIKLKRSGLNSKEIAETMDFSVCQIGRYLVNHKFTSERIIPRKEDQVNLNLFIQNKFRRSDLFGYFIGFGGSDMYFDFYMNRIVLEILTKDAKQIFPKIKKLLGLKRKHPIHKRVNLAGNSMSILIVHSKQLIDSIKKSELIQFKHRSNTTTIDRNLKCDKLTKKCLAAAIRGLLDGDGHVPKHTTVNKTVKFTGNKSNMVFIKKIVEKNAGLSRPLKIHRIKTRNRKKGQPLYSDTYEVRFTNKHDRRALYNFIYDNSTVHFSRKKKRFDKLVLAK